MSGYIFLASSKEIELPEKIAEYNNRRIFDEPNKSFTLSVPTEQDEWEIEQLRKIVTMPYIYYIGGLGSEYFWLYLEKYMEVGDVLEIISIYQQDETDIYVQKMLDNPEPIHINVGSLTYTNAYGNFQLNRKKWVDDLMHRTLVTDRGVTTIVKY
ncbi:MAG: hypothetical protein WAM95_18155 [Bacillus sp. (in: firmicutes)]|jgi:hypothetical protein